MPLGAQAARTVLSRIDGTSPAPITNGFVAQCVSLGRTAGTFQAARMDDTARWLSVSEKVRLQFDNMVADGKKNLQRNSVLIS